MNELKFKSQVCTTVEQSKKLLELGLKPDTADCHYILMDENWSLGVGFWKQSHQNVPTHYVPAWSLHRLMYIISEPYLSMNLNVKNNNLYDHIIAIIKNLIEVEKLNKEYLNK